MLLALRSFAERCINVWMPLESVGRDRPSLEIVPSSNERMRFMPLLPPGPTSARDAAFVATLGASFVPSLDPGDTLVFDQYTVHRTQDIGVPAGTYRTALEFRFSAEKH